MSISKEVITINKFSISFLRQLSRFHAEDFNWPKFDNRPQR